MSKLTTFAFAFLVLSAIVFTAPSVRAQDDAPATEATEGEDADVEVFEEGTSTEGDVEDELSETVPEEQVMYTIESPDVTTTVYFPEYLGEKKFVQGEDVTVLVGMSNSGDKTFNVSWVVASLYSPFDSTYYVQNFTAKYINSLLKPKSEITVEYKIKPDLSLEPVEFQLTGFIFYNDTATEIPHRHTFFNNTILLVEGKSELDAKTLFTYVLVLAAFGVAAYVFLNQKPKRSTTGTRGSSDSWDAQIYKPASKSRAVGSKKRSTKKSS